MTTRLVSEQSERQLGASLVEYALLLAFIAVVCVVAVNGLGGAVSTRLDGAGTSMFSN